MYARMGSSLFIMMPLINGIIRRLMVFLLLLSHKLYRDPDCLNEALCTVSTVFWKKIVKGKT
jgi:hypothetical protein